jgi:hypothetical protein
MITASAYLVQYGRPAFVGAMQARCASEGVGRGDRVVIRGPRGLEIGTVLVARATAMMPVDGEILRPAALDDFAAAERNEALGQKILTAAGDAGLPISFIDVEVSLDGATAVLHALPFGECDASPLFAELSDRFGLAVRLLDLSQTPTSKDPPDPTKATCGKPDCGTGSGGCTSCGTGGCSTGSCSKGSVTSAGELSAYFADLRRQMEASGLARTPLV